MKLALGSDHAGFGLKAVLAAWLRSAAGGRHAVRDVGTFTAESCDYPDFAFQVARRVASGGARRGILICGSGIGMAMAANKIQGVRAAVAWNPETAQLSAEHNNANVLCLPARFVDARQAKRMTAIFLKTPFGEGRHRRRVAKIRALDRCGD
ncbi:MAG TPA: ribose 5-phosphate isomerase B [Elusimicrobiota bacterium]|nr:ribose 5-phosphate isomerase B [Elusimicrobiota bacterium]